MRFFKGPGNLRYSLNTVVPAIVFLTSVLSSIITFNVIVPSAAHYAWIFAISAFSSACAFVVVLAMTQPIKDLVRKAEKVIRFEETRKESGQMIEVYKTIETLIEYAKSKEGYLKKEDEDVMKNIEKLDYIIPLGYMSLVVAHEVRNPLSTITGMSELLKEKLEEGQTKVYVETILDAAKKIDVFTKELLDFTDNDPAKEYINISKIVGEAINSLSSEFQKVECEFKGNGDIPFLGDGNKIYQAIYNVMKNAFEYEQYGGYVRIETKQGDSLIISVFNKSSTIDKEDIESIFKPFYSKKKGGKGIGLFIALRNIKMHGGDIEVESNEAGTRFVIELPVVENENTGQGLGKLENRKRV